MSNPFIKDTLSECGRCSKPATMKTMHPKELIGLSVHLAKRYAYETIKDIEVRYTELKEEPSGVAHKLILIIKDDIVINSCMIGPRPYQVYDYYNKYAGKALCDDCRKELMNPPVYVHPFSNTDDFRELPGTHIEDAILSAEAHGVTKIDIIDESKPCIRTLLFIADRLNLHIKNGLVTKAYFA